MGEAIAAYLAQKLARLSETSEAVAHRRAFHGRDIWPASLRRRRKRAAGHDRVADSIEAFILAGWLARPGLHRPCGLRPTAEPRPAGSRAPDARRTHRPKRQAERLFGHRHVVAGAHPVEQRDIVPGSSGWRGGTLFPDTAARPRAAPRVPSPPSPVRGWCTDQAEMAAAARNTADSRGRCRSAPHCRQPAREVGEVGESCGLDRMARRPPVIGKKMQRMAICTSGVGGDIGDGRFDPSLLAWKHARSRSDRSMHSSTHDVKTAPRSALTDRAKGRGSNAVVSAIGGLITISPDFPVQRRWRTVGEGIRFHSVSAAHRASFPQSVEPACYRGN